VVYVGRRRELGANGVIWAFRGWGNVGERGAVPRPRVVEAGEGGGFTVLLGSDMRGDHVAPPTDDLHVEIDVSQGVSTCVAESGRPQRRLRQVDALVGQLLLGRGDAECGHDTAVGTLK